MNTCKQRLRRQNIYIIGDLVYYEETPNTPTPQIVQAAEQTGHTAAANIVADIKGGENTPLKETTKDSWFPSARNGALPTYSIKFI